MARETKSVGKLITLGIKGFEIILELLLRYKEIGYVPLHTHIEYAGGTIDILVKIKDIAAVGGDEIGYHSYDARLIGTVHAKDGCIGVLSLFHKSLISERKVSEISHKTQP